QAAVPARSVRPSGARRWPSPPWQHNPESLSVPGTIEPWAARLDAVLLQRQVAVAAVTSDVRDRRPRGSQSCAFNAGAPANDWRTFRLQRPGSREMGGLGEFARKGH